MSRDIQSEMEEIIAMKSEKMREISELLREIIQSKKLEKRAELLTYNSERNSDKVNNIK